MRRITKNKLKVSLLIVLIAVFVWHIIAANTTIYIPNYEKKDISGILDKKTLSADDYMTIYKQTGVSPSAAKELVEDGDIAVLKELNKLYFQKQEIEKSFIVYPVTIEERNKEQLTPVVNLKKGDILITFNTHTMGWRHGHCAIVLDENSNTLLEHMSMGEVSCTTHLYGWRSYPSFVVLRYKDAEIAQKAAEYARKNLLGVPYNILAGVIKKDKTNEKKTSSHCSHIIWQAYKSAGVDIDKNNGIFVTPKDIAMSDELEVIQIYGVNPKKYSDRIKK